MLLIGILIALLVWMVITLIAIRVGGKLAGHKGAFIGFMLTMGGWFVYWAGEYVYIQHKVTQLCESEGGITVYVTPEQWRKQIGEAEWESLKFTGENVPYSQRNSITFKGKEYTASSQKNKRIRAYSRFEKTQPHINFMGVIYVDINTQKILAEIKSFSVPYEAIANSLAGLRFWLSDIKGCPFNKEMPLNDIIYKYSNSKLEN